MKVMECRSCGRHLIDGRWLYQINSKADGIACCPSCLRAEEERDELLRESQRRRTEQAAKDGSEVDVFSLLHYDAGDEFWRPKKK